MELLSFDLFSSIIFSCNETTKAELVKGLMEGSILASFLICEIHKLFIIK